MIEVKTVYRDLNILRQRKTLLLFGLWVVQPFLQFGFSRDSKTQIQSPKISLGNLEERLTRRSIVDRHHRLIHERDARRVLLTNRPKAGHSHSGNQDRGSHLGSDQR